MNTISVEIEGSFVTAIQSSGADLKPGDVYIAKRNTGWKLLICRKVDFDLGCVFPDNLDYAYNLHECHKVLSIN